MSTPSSHTSSIAENEVFSNVLNQVTNSMSNMRVISPSKGDGLVHHSRVEENAPLPSPPPGFYGCNNELSVESSSLPKTSSCSMPAKRTTLRRNSSTSNLSLNEASYYSQSDAQLFYFRQTLFNELALMLPTILPPMVAQLVESQVPKHSETNETSQLPEKVNKKSEKDFRHLSNKVDGQIRQMTEWSRVIKNNTDAIESLNKKLKNNKNNISDIKKSIDHKTSKYSEMENKSIAEFEELQKLKVKLQKQLEDSADELKKITAIDESQKFVAGKYDRILENQKKFEKDVGNLKSEVAVQTKKTEGNAKYTRRDCLEWGEVPVTLNDHGRENCKYLIIGLCKEMNYWLRPEHISTAHRLQQHESKTGPPPIIVKFTSRDIRNDVYHLRKLAKNKRTWRLPGLTRLFINESLTPDKKRLLYKTKVLAREIQEVHGKIYTWTFKGDIFLRKSADGAPVIPISSENDLIAIKNSDLSLDV